MNCQEFENNLIDRGYDASGRPAVLTDPVAQDHFAGCESCAARVAAQTYISAGLRAVVEGDEVLSAPAHVEAQLLAAFRRQADSEMSGPAGRLRPRFAGFGWRGLFAFAGLAVLLAVGWGWVNRVAGTGPVAPTSFASSPVSPTEMASGKELDPAALNSDSRPVNREVEAPPEMRPNMRRTVRNQSALLGRGRVTVDVGPFEIEDSSSPASLKDFMMFDYAENMAPPDGVQMMRVRMPPARLVNLGIPVPRNARSRDYINTDLLVGNDGTPRAIRVVY